MKLLGAALDEKDRNLTLAAEFGQVLVRENAKLKAENASLVKELADESAALRDAQAGERRRLADTLARVLELESELEAAEHKAAELGKFSCGPFGAGACGSDGADLKASLLAQALSSEQERLRRRCKAEQEEEKDEERLVSGSFSEELSDEDELMRAPPSRLGSPGRRLGSPVRRLGGGRVCGTCAASQHKVKELEAALSAAHQEASEARARVDESDLREALLASSIEEKERVLKALRGENQQLRAAAATARAADRSELEQSLAKQAKAAKQLHHELSEVLEINESLRTSSRRRSSSSGRSGRLRKGEAPAPAPPEPVRASLLDELNAVFDLAATSEGRVREDVAAGGEDGDEDVGLASEVKALRAELDDQLGALCSPAAHKRGGRRGGLGLGPGLGLGLGPDLGGSPRSGHGPGPGPDFGGSPRSAGHSYGSPRSQQLGSPRSQVSEDSFFVPEDPMFFHFHMLVQGVRIQLDRLLGFSDDDALASRSDLSAAALYKRAVEEGVPFFEFQAFIERAYTRMLERRVAPPSDAVREAGKLLRQGLISEREYDHIVAADEMVHSHL